MHSVEYNVPGDGVKEVLTRLVEGFMREESAITGDDDMLDHKFDDGGKTVASYGNCFTPNINVPTKNAASIPAVVGQ